MNQRFKVYPYIKGSASAKALARALGNKVLKLTNSKYRPRKGDVVVNWGASDVPQFEKARVLNHDVSLAQCKLKALQNMERYGVRVPPYATHIREAENLKFPVMCRTKLRGHSGAGIEIANDIDDLVPAPLYTQYIKKKDEFRVHVVADEHGATAFYVQRKARKLNVDNPDWKVRNLAGGFVFVETPIENVHTDVLEQACQAVIALGLDFGGVDVIWNQMEEKAYVLEVNTACGLEERTAQHYKYAILDIVEG
jgi:glutathione synthase/RimK-type ligase-like ATP-grasp enzyme